MFSSEQILKIGFIGFGIQASQTHAKYIVENYTPESVKIVAICDILRDHVSIVQENLQKLGLDNIPLYPIEQGDPLHPENVNSVDKFINDHHHELDAVIISTPYAKHFYQIKKCLNAGLHVLVDKPLSLSYQNAKELVELANHKNLCLVVSSQRRYELVYQYIKKATDNEELGEIVAIDSIISQAHEWLYGWRNDPKLCGGGALWNLGWHSIDTIIYLTDKKVLAVDGFLYPPNTSIEDHANAIIYFNNDLAANITVNHLSPNNSVYERLQIWGTKGMISIDRFKPVYDMQQPKVTHQMSDGHLVVSDLSKAIPMKWAPTKAFIDYLLCRKKSKRECKELQEAILSSGVRSLDTVRTIEAIYISAQNNKRIYLKEIR